MGKKIAIAKLMIRIIRVCGLSWTTCCVCQTSDVWWTLVVEGRIMSVWLEGPESLDRSSSEAIWTVAFARLHGLLSGSQRHEQQWTRQQENNSKSQVKIGHMAIAFAFSLRLADIQPVWFNWSTVKFWNQSPNFFTDRHTEKRTYCVSPEVWYRPN